MLSFPKAKTTIPHGTKALAQKVLDADPYTSNP